MNKPVLGLILGTVLGFFDGLTALFAGPEVKEMMVSICIGSSVKGLIVGLLAGFYARKVQSVPKGLLVGAALGLFFAFLIAAMPADESGKHYWVEIMVPGTLVGFIVGFATQKYGKTPALRV